MLSLSVLLPAAALTRYDDHGEPKLSAGERLLVVLNRSGWVTRSEINEALGLDDDTEGTSLREEREVLSAALRHAVDRGAVQRRVVCGTRQYRLDATRFGTERPRGRGGRPRKR